MNKRALREKVRNEWHMWRPVLEKVITYTEMCNMYDDELAEVNMAIDIFIEEENRRQKKQMKKSK